MIYLKEFDSHASYETEVNGGGVDFKIPNVSYCNDANDVHFNPYNTVEFYVDDITGTTPQTVSIYTDYSTFIPIQVSEGNKWYSYVLPKDKRLFKIYGSAVKKVVVKANITTTSMIIPSSTVEALFKGSNTTNLTSTSYMFNSCSNLTSLDVSSFDTSNVTDMGNMFVGCSSLTSLDLRNFNTSNVTEMGSMFSSCTSLNSLVLSGWDTSNVTNMNNMFNGCSGLTSLDLSGWDTSKVTDMGSMFNGCPNSMKIRMVGCTPETRTKIEDALTAAGIRNNVTIIPT